MDYFARFTEGAKRALACAAENAKSIGHNYVGSEHLLIGIYQEQGPVAEMLQAQGLAQSRAEELLEKATAEAVEQRAALRGHIQSAAADFAALQKDLDVMKTHLTSELRKMDVAISQLPLACNKVGGEIKALEQKVSE